MDRQDLEFLIDLQERMNKQDETSASCDFQASPYFWSVAENKIEWGIDPDYCTDEVCFYYDGESYYSVEECKELFKDLLEEDCCIYQTLLDRVESICDWNDVESYVDENEIEGSMVYGRKIEDIISKHTGCFLTKQSCKEHIEKNSYNYSEPHTFAMTADRNPEFERVWNILKKTDWKQLSDLEAKLAESENEIASLEVCLLENKNNMKEMQEFKIGEDEYDLTDEDARNDLRDYIQEFEKVSKRVYEQKEYAEKILRMSTSEEHQEILQLKQQLAETDKLMQEYLSKCLSLEQQLEEKDQAIEGLQEINQSLGQTCNNDAKEIERLREQLEEKEDLLKTYIQLNEDLTKRLDDRCDICIERHKQSQSQTAIAELVNIQKYISDNVVGVEQECFGRELNDKIDQQIKLLKGDK